jgi:hypothetical protein
MTVRNGKNLVVGKERRLSGTHVSKDDPADLLQRESGMANRVLMFAASRFSGLLQTTTVNVVEPAVIDAAEASVLHPPIAQVCPAVRAMETQEPGPSLVVAKKD